MTSDCQSKYGFSLMNDIICQMQELKIYTGKIAWKETKNGYTVHKYRLTPNAILSCSERISMTAFMLIIYQCDSIKDCTQLLEEHKQEFPSPYAMMWLCAHSSL